MFEAVRLPVHPRSIIEVIDIAKRHKTPGSPKTAEFPSEFSPTSSSPMGTSHSDPTPATNRKLTAIGGAGVRMTVGDDGNSFRMGDPGYRLNNDNNGYQRMEIARQLERKILGSLEVWGALGLGQLMALCGKSAKNTVRLVSLCFNESFSYPGGIYLCLRRLERRGLIKVYRDIYTKQIYGLTHKGHGYLEKCGLSRFNSHLGRLPSRTLEHRITSNSVGIFLSLFRELHVLSEREVYYFVRDNFGGKMPKGFHLPDLIVSTRGSRFPVEVELSRKRRARYAELWQNYSTRLRDSDSVLYLMRTPQSAHSFLGLTEKLSVDFIFVSDIKTLRSTAGRNPFRNFRGQAVSLL